MNIASRYVFPVFVVLLCVVLTVGMVGCSLSQVQTAVQQVLNDMPTIINIVSSVLAIVAAAKGLPAAQFSTLQAQAQNIEGQVTADLKTIQTILAAYQQGLGSAPISVLQKLDALDQAITQNLAALETAFHIVNVKLQAAIATVSASVSGFLLAVESLIPATLVQFMPNVRVRLSAGAVIPGSGTMVPSARTIAKNFNHAISPLCPGAKVHVPWIHVLGMPVLP